MSGNLLGKRSVSFKSHTTKANVFEDLFSDASARLALYQTLHSEDTGVTAEDIELITLSHIFLRGRYNDLGMRVGSRLIVLVEAQSIWSPNIIPRSIMYLSDTWNRYGAAQEFDWYSSTTVPLPEAELYVVYTGDRKDVKTSITLSEEFFGGWKTAIDATVKVLIYDGGNDIINQYIAFCRKIDECRRKYPKDARKAITEAIDFCIESGILADYLKKRRPEVINIMIALFSEEHAREMERVNERKEALEEGQQRIFSLYNKLKNAGREKEFDLASKDPLILEHLYKEFDL